MKLYVNKPAMVQFITIFTLQNTLHHIYCFLKEIISHVLEFIFLYFSNTNCFFLCAIYIVQHMRISSLYDVRVIKKYDLNDFQKKNVLKMGAQTTKKNTRTKYEFHNIFFINFEDYFVGNSNFDTFQILLKHKIRNNLLLQFTLVYCFS